MDSAHGVATALDTLATLPGVQECGTRVAQAVRSVRFSTGLRRGWEGARAEASVRWVLRECAMLGRDVTAQALREQIAWRGDPDDPVAAAAWRCHSDAVNSMPPLNTKDTAPPRQVPMRALLAGLHRDAASTQESNSERNAAGILSPSDLNRQELLMAIAESKAPAIVVLSVLLGQWLTDPLTVPGDSFIRDSFVRSLATSRGLEPTGIAVLDIQSLRDGLAHYERGDSEGMVAWFTLVADSFVDAMSEALRISQSVLAGRTDPELP